jgi:uncharacterized membrane protein YiaA
VSDAPKRRAGDEAKPLRAAGGWAGIAMGVLAFVVGLWRDNDPVMIGAFLAVMVASNVLPFDAVRKLVPWGRA